MFTQLSVSTFGQGGGNKQKSSTHWTDCHRLSSPLVGFSLERADPKGAGQHASPGTQLQRDTH